MTSPGDFPDGDPCPCPPSQQPEVFGSPRVAPPRAKRPETVLVRSRPEAFPGDPGSTPARPYFLLVQEGRAGHPARMSWLRTSGVYGKEGGFGIKDLDCDSIMFTLHGSARLLASGSVPQFVQTEELSGQTSRPAQDFSPAHGLLKRPRSPFQLLWLGKCPRGIHRVHPYIFPMDFFFLLSSVSVTLFL